MLRSFQARRRSPSDNQQRLAERKQNERRLLWPVSPVEPLEGRVLFAGGSIGGTIFEDVTGDGVSAGDGAVGGRAVQLFRDNGDGVLGAGDAAAGSATTKSDGTYSFKSLAAGTYFVQEALPANWVQTAPVARRRGLGRHLTRAVAQWALQRGAVRAYLQVEERNTAAVGLYQGLGFSTHHTYLTREAPR